MFLRQFMYSARTLSGVRLIYFQFSNGDVPSQINCRKHSMEQNYEQKITNTQADCLLFKVLFFISISTLNSFYLSEVILH